MWRIERQAGIWLGARLHQPIQQGWSAAAYKSWRVFLIASDARPCQDYNEDAEG